MPSRIKLTGKVGCMLRQMADRGGTMTTDCRFFPPSKVMHPFHRRGLVVLRRSGILKSRYNQWHLTPKGWDAIGRSPPPTTDETAGRVIG